MQTLHCLKCAELQKLKVKIAPEAICVGVALVTTKDAVAHPPVTGTMSKLEGSQQQSSKGLCVSCPLQQDVYCARRLYQPLPVWAKVVAESTHIPLICCCRAGGTL